MRRLVKVQELKALKEEMRFAIRQINRFCYFSRKQQYYYSNQIMVKLWERLPEIVDLLAKHMQALNEDNVIFDLEGLAFALQEIQKAQLAKDYVLLVDLYELQLLPVFIAVEEKIAVVLGVQVEEALFLKNVESCHCKNPQLLYSLFQENMIKECLQNKKTISDACMAQVIETVERCMEKGYVVEPTSSGYDTLAIRDGEHLYYMHSNGSITSEAMQLAQEWLVQGKENYTFYGLGFGYAYLEMLEMDHNVSVRVFEGNRELLILAMVFAPLWHLLEEERFELIYDPTAHKMKKDIFAITEESGMYVFYPALKGIRKKTLQEQLETYFMEESSVRTQMRSLEGNFKKNSRVQAESMKELQNQFKGKKVIIVAAGPSLDKNIRQLREKTEGTLLVAVGTVLKKLLHENVIPDYVIMTDANESIYRQIEDIEDSDVPLIFLSTVYSKVTQNYKGKKYMLCQSGFAPSEKYAKAKEIPLVNSGGSVITVALDMCLQLQVSQIIFVGLDLAYTNHLDHAAETAEQAAVVQETGVFVDATDGGKIATGKNLRLYLKWIENRLAKRTDREQQVRVIDATEGGAYKKGMEQMTLQQALQE